MPPTLIAVLGAGAAGLMAALRAAERGCEVVVLEKNRRAGVKILISGGTRCNLTHDGDARGIMAAFGANGGFLRPALSALSPAALRRFFEEEGLPLYVEEASGKVFPRSDRSRDVLAALLRRFGRSGARLQLNEPVRAVERAGGGFRVRGRELEFEARAVILAVGGRSYPSVGTAGDGYAMAAALGHRIVTPRPALVALTSGDPRVTGLAGLDLQDAEVRLYEPGSARPLDRRRAPLLFTHFGLSGPAAMDVSRAVTAHPRPAALRVEADLLPAESAAALDDWLRAEAAAGGRRQVVTVLDARLARRLAGAVLDAARVPADRRLSELSRAERAATVAALKGFPVPLSGTLGFDKAEVTAGGVALDEVDPKTMQSRLVPGLFFAGEVLDLDGWIGGYNFQAAFSTGWLAGSSVSRPPQS